MGQRGGLRSTTPEVGMEDGEAGARSRPSSATRLLLIKQDATLSLRTLHQPPRVFPECEQVYDDPFVSHTPGGGFVCARGGGFGRRLSCLEHIMCKLIHPQKPCKLQPGPPDQHSRGGRRGSGRKNLQKCDYLIQGRAVNCKVTPLPMPLDIDPVAQIEVCIVFMNNWFALDMFPSFLLYIENKSLYTNQNVYIRICQI